MRRTALFLTVIGLCVFIYTLITLSSLTVNEDATSTRRRSNVISKSRIFPQSGDSEKLDQPWLLPSIKVDDKFDEGRFIFSNFSYSKGLGNLMFQFASLYGVAAAHNASVVLSRTNLLRKPFTLKLEGDGKVKFAEKELIDRKLKEMEKEAVVQTECCNFNEYHLDFPNGQAVLNGYFQNKKYFYPKHFGELRSMFSFHDEIRQMASEFIRNAMMEAAISGGEKMDTVPGDEAVLVDEDPMSSSTHVVGIHVRRGMDILLNERNKKHGHVAAPMEYYQKAMELAKRDHEKVIFLICSDDVGWAKKHFQGDNHDPVFFCPGEYREVDMCILTMVDSLIISTGTFSWWTAFLAQNAQKVFYYGGWPRQGSDLDNMINKTEYFMDEWVAVQ